uniref:Protein kinase domain-containing protein n=1 Tax=Alexandrium monilatum TaxID=311494 RepID=A0A7S4VB78_9DINO
MGNACCAGGIAQLFRGQAQHSEGRRQGSVLPTSGALVQLSGHEPSSAACLLESYDISVELLGSGSFGVIRRATCRWTGSARALKTVDKGQLPDFALEDLAKELRIQGDCLHPNIVRIYGSFEDEEQFHIALEACEGGDVRDFMFAQKVLCESAVGFVMWQVLTAVQYLHEVKHVAHRDLKLENLLLAFGHVPLEDNLVKITDFGMATTFEPGVRNLSMICGTAEYLAPEVPLGRYDEKCDLWSCGAILFELLSGRLPFDAGSQEETMLMARVCPVPLDRVSASKEAKAVLRSLCQKDPRSRASAEQALQSAWLGQYRPDAGGPAAEESGGRHVEDRPVPSEAVASKGPCGEAACGPAAEAGQAAVLQRLAVAGSGATDYADADSASPAVSSDSGWEALSCSGRSGSFSSPRESVREPA